MENEKNGTVLQFPLFFLCPEQSMSVESGIVLFFQVFFSFLLFLFLVECDDKKGGDPHPLTEDDADQDDEESEGKNIGE